MLGVLNEEKLAAPREAWKEIVKVVMDLMVYNKSL
jgi:hypothetical protein